MPSKTRTIYHWNTRHRGLVYGLVVHFVGFSEHRTKTQTFLKMGSSSEMILFSLVPSGNVRTRTRRFFVGFEVAEIFEIADALPLAISFDKTVRLISPKTTCSDFRLRLTEVVT